MPDISLPPDLERFAAEAVASGRFHDVSDVVRRGVELLQQQEHARTALVGSVLAAQDEGDRLGYVNGDNLLDRIEAQLARREAQGR